MNIEAHLATLQKKHDDLEEALRHEEARPLPDEAKLHQIKHEKLKIKEEMESFKK
ncbi:MAG TPA: hypothetical protein DCW68_04445 [Rhodospirillaceae bacterium]|nr:hypothetical protein [Rhodospirillaceae bacterium]